MFVSTPKFLILLHSNAAPQFVPHDIAKIIELLGGEETFLKRLEFFHTSGLADIGNEPVFLTVYMPHYAGRPGLSAKRAHYCTFEEPLVVLVS